VTPVRTRRNGFEVTGEHVDFPFDDGGSWYLTLSQSHAVWLLLDAFFLRPRLCGAPPTCKLIPGFFWAILVPPHLLAMYFLNPPVFHIALHFRGVNEFPCAIPGFRVEFRVSGPLGTPLEPPDTRHETLNTRQPPKKPFASGPTHTKMKKWFFWSRVALPLFPSTQRFVRLSNPTPPQS